eukprot:scaffold8166_cov92-Skeletonema_menzelii.AAC.1
MRVCPIDENNVQYEERMNMHRAQLEDEERMNIAQSKASFTNKRNKLLSLISPSILLHTSGKRTLDLVAHMQRQHLFPWLCQLIVESTQSKMQFFKARAIASLMDAIGRKLPFSASLPDDSSSSSHQ